MMFKRNFAAVGVDYDTALKSTAENDVEKTSELPDGNIISVVATCCRYAKALFLLNSTSKGSSGLHDTSFQSTTRIVTWLAQEQSTSAQVNIVAVSAHVFHFSLFLLSAHFCF